MFECFIFLQKIVADQIWHKVNGKICRMYTVLLTFELVEQLYKKLAYYLTFFNEIQYTYVNAPKETKGMAIALFKTDRRTHTHNGF